jgi:predicted ATPase
MNDKSPPPPPLFVLTGGPGAGKTSVLTELQHRGYICVREAARAIIQQQVKAGSDGVPWRNMERYSALMLEQSIADYLSHASGGTLTFFDRGIPDTIAHFRLAGLPLPQDARQQARQCRYNRTVFLLPPWREIYETDSERKQSFEEALASCEMVRNVYAELEYQLIEVPRGPVAARADFILGRTSEC